MCYNLQTGKFSNSWTTVRVTSAIIYKPQVRPDVACEILMGKEKFTLLDIRSTRDNGMETFRGAVSLPAVVKTGRPLNWELEPAEDWVAALKAKYPDKESRLVIMSAGNREEHECLGEEFVDGLLNRLVEEGYTDFVEAKGGYHNWLNYWTPGGKKRPPEGDYKVDHASPGTLCVGSEFKPIDESKSTYRE